MGGIVVYGMFWDHEVLLCMFSCMSYLCGLECNPYIRQICGMNTCIRYLGQVKNINLEVQFFHISLFLKGKLYINIHQLYTKMMLKVNKKTIIYKGGQM